MGRLFSFFSYALLTQFVLAMNQIFLVPIQLHSWGVSATAKWYAAIAVATITTFADLGLRTAGHAELIRFVNPALRHPGDEEYLTQLWTWIRILVCAVTCVLIAWSASLAFLAHEPGGGLWKDVLLAAYALETLLVIRIVFLDSVGYYRQAERTYLTFAVCRFGTSLLLLLVWRVGIEGLAVGFLISSVVGLLLQERLCAKAGVLRLWDHRWGGLPLKVLGGARYTLADPLSTWCRLSMPVLVISSIGTPAAVTIYVALRAVFSAARTTIQQLARVASVEYLRMHAATQRGNARPFLGLSVQAAGFLGTLVGGLVIADNQRALGLWLKQGDQASFQIICATLALSVSFCGSQIFVNLLFRVGKLREVARAEYCYLLYSVLFALLGVAVKSLALYLSLTVAAEIILSASIMLPKKIAATPDCAPIARLGFAFSCGGAIVLAAIWFAVKTDHNYTFTQISAIAVWRSAGILLTWLTLLALAQMVVNANALRALYRIAMPRVDGAKQIAH